MEEFEITFLDVDVSKLKSNLLEIEAEKVGDFDFKRALFDYSDTRMNDKGSWLRLRTDGKDTTLAYKEKTPNSNGGVKEIEVKVDSYEKTYKLLKAIGLVVKREEENKRTKYKKGETIFDIDSWPQIPTYLEIESSSIEEAKRMAKEVGLDPEDSLILSPMEGYKKYGYDLNEYSSVTFKVMIKK
jgi:adenylate cyclase, class 2